MRHLDARLVIEEAQQFQHIGAALRIHGAALDWDQYMVGKADRLGQQRTLRARKIDDEIIRRVAVFRDMPLDRCLRHIGNHIEARQAGGKLVPARDPALRICIENGDAVTDLRKLGCEQKHRSRLAGAALGIGESDDGHS
ncbi:hypothetical protein D3C71_1671300 [compost metagenome]